MISWFLYIALRDKLIVCSNFWLNLHIRFNFKTVFEISSHAVGNFDNKFYMWNTVTTFSVRPIRQAPKANSQDSLILDRAEGKTVTIFTKIIYAVYVTAV